MIPKEIDNYLEALAGYINDDDKLVTYKWLSKELNIHVNLAKKILFQFWDQQKNQNDSVTATFLLIGYLKDGGLRVEVVKEADLQSAKNKFTKTISEHIYSLQKILPDIELLAITDKSDSQQSAIRCVDSVIRSEHEMQILRWGTASSGLKSANNVQNSIPKISGPKTAEVKLVDKQNDVKEHATKAAAVKSAEKTQKSAFNNFFAKAADKNAEAKLTDKPNSVKEHAIKAAGVKPTEKTQKSAFNNLFGKAMDKQNKEGASSQISFNNTKSKSTANSTTAHNSLSKNSWFEVTKKPQGSTNEAEKEQTESSNGIHKPLDQKTREQSPKSNKVLKRKSPEKIIVTDKSVDKKKATSTSVSRGKKRQSSSKRESTSKRHKRILVPESSDESSSSETMDIEEPDFVEEEPHVVEKTKTCPSPPLIKCEEGRRKVRKLVDKTFMDENGYFVTQKEYVYESCSDKEEEPAPVETNKSPTTESAIQNVNKRKQATLLNFFKKS